MSKEIINSYRSPFSPVREAGILRLLSPSGRVIDNPQDISNDPRYQGITNHAKNNKSDYQQQLSKLQGNQLANLKNKGLNQVDIDFNRNIDSHIFSPLTGIMTFNGKQLGADTLQDFNHETYHPLSFLDNKNYANILQSMVDANHDESTWNQIRNTIDPKGKLLQNYPLPNFLKGNDDLQNQIRADELGGFGIENADNPLAFKNASENTKPFFNKYFDDLKRIYQQYDPENNYPAIPNTLNTAANNIKNSVGNSSNTLVADARQNLRDKKSAKNLALLRDRKQQQIMSQGFGDQYSSPDIQRSRNDQFQIFNQPQHRRSKPIYEMPSGMNAQQTSENKAHLIQQIIKNHKKLESQPQLRVPYHQTLQQFGFGNISQYPQQMPGNNMVGQQQIQPNNQFGQTQNQFQQRPSSPLGMIQPKSSQQPPNQQQFANGGRVRKFVNGGEVSLNPVSSMGMDNRKPKKTYMDLINEYHQTKGPSFKYYGPQAPVSQDFRGQLQQRVANRVNANLADVQQKYKQELEPLQRQLKDFNSQNYPNRLANAEHQRDIYKRDYEQSNKYYNDAYNMAYNAFTANNKNAINQYSGYYSPEQYQQAINTITNNNKYYKDFYDNLISSGGSSGDLIWFKKP